MTTSRTIRPEKRATDDPSPHLRAFGWAPFWCGGRHLRTQKKIKKPPAEPLRAPPQDRRTARRRTASGTLAYRPARRAHASRSAYGARASKDQAGGSRYVAAQTFFINPIQISVHRYSIKTQTLARLRINTVLRQGAHRTTSRPRARHPPFVISGFALVTTSPPRAQGPAA